MGFTNRKLTKIERILYLSIFFLVLLIVLSREFYRIESTNKGKRLELSELQDILKEPLVMIEVLPDQLSRKEFEYIITDEDSLNVFLNAARKANGTNVSGHSDPIYKSIIVLTTSLTKKKYRASVHRYEPEDLFISSSFYTKNSNGNYSLNNFNRIRLPGLGKWIQSNAPKGTL